MAHDLDDEEYIATRKMLGVDKTADKRIKELEADLYSANCIIAEQIDLLRDSIPKQKIEKLLIEIKKEINKIDEETDDLIKDTQKDLTQYYKTKENVAIMQTLAWCRDNLEEILEEKERGNSK